VPHTAEAHRGRRLSLDSAHGPVGLIRTPRWWSAWSRSHTDVPVEASLRRCSHARHIASRRAIASADSYQRADHRWSARPSSPTLRRKGGQTNSRTNSSTDP